MNRSALHPLVTVLMLVAVCPAHAGAHRQEGVGVHQPEAVAAEPGVRSSHSGLSAVIRAAAERSMTFRGLLQTIEATDGIVYVEHGICPSHARGCLLSTVTISGRHRVLQIVVNANAREDYLMGTIGHELQHAIEVLRHRNIRTASALYLFYRRIGLVRGRAFETNAAVKVGNSVLAEVLQSRRTASRP
jgi:hypothetical protein